LQHDFRLQAFLLCDKVIREASGKAHIQGVFDRIWAPKFPAMHAQMTAYYRVGLPQGYQPRTMCLNVMGPEMLRVKMPDLAVATPKARLLEGQINIQGFLFPTPGRYTFFFVVDGKDVAEYGITLIPLQQDGTRNADAN